MHGEEFVPALCNFISIPPWKLCWRYEIAKHISKWMCFKSVNFIEVFKQQWDSFKQQWDRGTKSLSYSLVQSITVFNVFFWSGESMYVTPLSLSKSDRKGHNNCQNVIIFIHSLPKFNLSLIGAFTWLTPPGPYRPTKELEGEGISSASHNTFLTTQGHGGPPRMSDQLYAGATSETTQT